MRNGTKSWMAGASLMGVRMGLSGESFGWVARCRRYGRACPGQLCVSGRSADSRDTPGYDEWTVSGPAKRCRRSGQLCVGGRSADSRDTPGYDGWAVGSSANQCRRSGQLRIGGRSVDSRDTPGHDGWAAGGRDGQCRRSGQAILYAVTRPGPQRRGSRYARCGIAGRRSRCTGRVRRSGRAGPTRPGRQ
jgi:hypothetical protein